MPRKPSPDTLDFLLANICHLHRARIQQLFETLGLYQGQPPLLRLLWDQEGLTQTDLGERLKIAPATVTKMLQRMEKTGFIARKPDPEDQRISRVYLTEAGRAVQDRVEEVFRTLEAETFANLTHEEALLLRRLFLQIRENLLAATGEAPWK
jgi:MarR family transcriptional regulator, organic hydroperoxide resistance regulator